MTKQNTQRSYIVFVICSIFVFTKHLRGSIFNVKYFIKKKRNDQSKSKRKIFFFKLN